MHTCTDPEGWIGVRTPPPAPERSQKYRVSKQYWSGSPVKPQRFNVGPPLSHQRNGISLAGRLMARLKWYQLNKKRSQSWTLSEKLSGSGHGPAVA